MFHRKLSSAILVAAILAAPATAQDPVTVDVTFAYESASHEVTVTVDVTIDEEAENPEMYFFVEWNGGSCYTSAEPVAAGADQTFEVLFGCEIPSSPTQVNIVAVIVYDGSTEVESEPEQVVN